MDTSLDLTLDLPLLIGWVVAVVLPALVGLVTHRMTSSLAKSLLLAGLNALVTLLTRLVEALTTGDPFPVAEAVLQLLTALVLAWSAWGGFWKPSGLGEALQGKGRTAPEERAAR